MWVAWSLWAARCDVRDRAGDELVDGLTAVATRGRAGGFHLAAAGAEGQLALELFRRGEDTEARRLTTPLLPELRGTNPMSLLPILTLDARLRAREGDAAGARVLLGEAQENEALAASVEFAFVEPADVVSLAIELGDLAAAERVVQVLPAPAEYPVPQRKHLACRALLAEAQGRPAEAASLFAEAAAAALQEGSTARRADYLLGLGRCLFATGDPAADAPLREARDAFVRFGWRPAAAEAEALLAATREPAPS